MTDSSSYIFECTNISKSFGGTQALKGVQLKIGSGEVHALLGENGAGKSTLMKIIIGLYRPDSGIMKFQNDEYKVQGPAEAFRKGVSMIFQELNPEPHLTIAESIFLHREDTYGKTPFLNKRATNQRARELLKRFNLDLDPEIEIRRLSLAQIQMVEIVKAVSSNAKMIIMDEPTSSLDSEETNRLFNTISDLKKNGVSVIYISHRIDEIFSICDKVSVFRDGMYLSTHNVENISKEELINLMVGRKIETIFPKVDCEIGKPVLRIEDISGKGFRNISFEVKAGEIVGLSGLVGSGRSETARAIFGIDPIISGKIFLNDKEIRLSSPRDAIKLGICMVNEDRKRFGLCLHRSIRENISLPNLYMRQKGILINVLKERLEVIKISKELSLRARSIEDNAYSLSGGNQQKVVLAKWLLSNPKVLILDEPTRGVDVGAKSEIHRIMCELASEGLAILMISSELPEILGMSDRVIIYHEGKMNGEISREQLLNGSITEEEILTLEFGQSLKEKSNGK